MMPAVCFLKHMVIELWNNSDCKSSRVIFAMVNPLAVNSQGDHVRILTWIEAGEFDDTLNLLDSLKAAAHNAFLSE